MSIAAQLLAVLVPPACTTCRAPIPAAGSPVCAACLRALPWLPRRICPRCALPRHPARGCPAAAAAYATAWAPLAYEGTARAMVTALKFHAALPLAELMAAQIAANAPAGRLAAPCGPTERDAVIVPVPAAPARARRRGFDPAAAIAAALAGRTGLPLSCCLRRRGSAPRQVGASRRERRAGGRLRIEAARAPPAVAILVDDVHTTGATLEACARALRASGAHRVHALTYARTL